MPEISIIVPVYNVEKYLERCVRSILAQTFTDFELLLINDGSTDRSGELCDVLAKEDDRIRVVHKENGGASSARNVGIELARGTYLAFVDSDDWIAPNMYHSLLKLIKDHDAEIAECDYEIVTDLSEIVRQPSLEILELSNIECSRALYNGQRHCTILIWNKLYCRKLFSKLRFPEGMICEDQWLLPKIYMKASKVVYSNQKYYFYYQSPNSVMRSQFGRKNLAALVAFEETRNLYLQSNCDELVWWCDATFSFLLIHYYNRVIEELHDKRIAWQIKRYYNLHFFEYMKNPYILTKPKVLLCLYRLCPSVGKVF